jgi:chemotaxis protein methyltransferase CheR
MPAEVEKPAAVPRTAAEEARDPLYLRLRDLIYQTCGIYHPEEKLYLLVGACKRRMDGSKTNSAHEYFDLLNSPSKRETELRELLNEITIGETCLFRSQAQLNALHNLILPELAGTRGKIGLRRLRIWSAGCSTGEEPHTLAMFLLEESEKLLKGWTFEIVATDLNDRSLETAKAGIYGDYALRNTNEYFKRKYFHPCPDGRLEANSQVKALISFSRLNLGDDTKMVFMKGMDLIFCCNVLIYFDVASKRRVVQHFYSNLLTGGYFFLGLSESLFQVTDQFRLVHLPGTTAYWKAPADAPGGAKK